LASLGLWQGVGIVVEPLKSFENHVKKKSHLKTRTGVSVGTVGKPLCQGNDNERRIARCER